MISRRAWLLAALAGAGCSRSPGEEPLWVGHVAPFTGTERAAGDRERNGIRLAIEEVNRDREGKDRRIAVLHADSRGQLDQARQEAVRLVAVNKVLAVLGAREQATADRLGLALQPYPTPLLTPAAHGPPALEETFSLDVAPAFRGACLARFAGEQQGLKEALVLVDERIPACSAVASAFAARWRATPGRTLQTWDLASEEKPARFAERLARRKGALLFAGKAGDLEALGELEMSVLFGGEEIEWRRLERGRYSLANVHGATVRLASQFDERGQAFLKRYTERYAEEAGPDAWAGYEMARVVSAGLRKAPGTGALGLRDVLTSKEQPFPGLTGPLRFREGHALRPLYIVAFRPTVIAHHYVPEA